MTPEQTFSQLLGLGMSWQVVRTEFEEKTATFVICVEETAELWPEESSRAGTTVTCYDHVEPMQWRHLNVFNKECVIVCALPSAARGQSYLLTQVPVHHLGCPPNLGDGHPGWAGNGAEGNPRRSFRALILAGAPRSFLVLEIAAGKGLAAFPRAESAPKAQGPYRRASWVFQAKLRGLGCHPAA